MALSNAERQRRYRERLIAKARIADIPGGADLIAIYEAMRAQYFAEVTESQCDGDTPAYRKHWQKLAALPPDQRSNLETPDAISAAMFNLIGQTIERAYGKDLRRVARSDRAIVSLHKEANAHESARAVVYMIAGAEGG